MSLERMSIEGSEAVPTSESMAELLTSWDKDTVVKGISQLGKNQALQNETADRVYAQLEKLLIMTRDTTFRKRLEEHGVKVLEPES